MPYAEGRIALPAIKGYYEDKEEKSLSFMLRDGSVPAGFKRAKLGSCCALEGSALRYWSARTDGVTRIRRGDEGEDTLPFATRCISAGQVFEGVHLSGRCRACPADCPRAAKDHLGGRGSL